MFIVQGNVSSFHHIHHSLITDLLSLNVIGDFLHFPKSKRADSLLVAGNAPYSSRSNKVIRAGVQEEYKTGNNANGGYFCSLQKVSFLTRSTHLCVPGYKNPKA